MSFNLTLTSEAVLYSWRQIFQRAGLKEFVLKEQSYESHGVSFHYRALSSRDETTSHNIFVIPCGTSAVSRLLLDCGPINRLSMNRCIPDGSNLPFHDSIPVLFWGVGCKDSGKPFAEKLIGGSIVFYVDIIAATFFMLSRWEEIVLDVRDRHNRFPCDASVSSKYDFLDRPIIDEYALIAQKWLKILMPTWLPEMNNFAVRLSHDIDRIHPFSSWSDGVRILFGDLFKRRSFCQMVDTVDYLRKMRSSIFFQSIYELAELSTIYGFRSTFYFMATARGVYEQGYDYTSAPLKRCINDLSRSGHEIGFHSSYHAVDDLERFRYEKSCLEVVTGQKISSGRSHFLRFHVPRTWRMYDEAGLSCDSTLGYAEVEGFRCGTCHCFRPFDSELNRELDVIEVPLIVMDGTLKEYRKLTPQQGQDRILVLAKRCKQVNGTFTILWHNSSWHGSWKPWADMYRRTLPLLAQFGSNERVS